MTPGNVPYPLLNNNPAPGGPGAPPYWARADKDGLGTAMSSSSLIWYTMAGGVITELYYPTVDTPQVRDIQFIVTDKDGTFFHDPKVDYTHACKPIIPSALGYSLTNTAKTKPYSLVHDVISEPGAACLLIRTKIQGDAALVPTLRVFLLLAPHMEGAGANNSGFVAATRQGNVLTAHRGNTWLAAGADCGFTSTGCGYVGVNDGWQDIIGNRRIPIWNYDSVFNGNIALTAEIDLAGATEFVVAVAFGEGDDATPNGAITALSEALSNPFEAPAGSPPTTYSHLSAFEKGWTDKGAAAFVPAPNATFDNARLYNVSRNVLLAHEDKTYNGALVASMSIPWGDANGDSDDGGYHLVWPRDMSQSATALLSTGETDLPLRGLMFLAATQKPDGSWFQNFYISGKGHWTGLQLDEFSFPIVLAYRLSLAGALQAFDPRSMVLAAAGALIQHGPATPEERWEENSGYSPSTLASNIAGLVCAAFFANQKAADAPTAQFLLEYSDFLESHLEAWTVTTKGELLPGVPRHYIRILPTSDPTAPEDPDTALLRIANRAGSPVFPARNIVDAGFLELVRYGIRAPGDPLIEDSLRVIDASLKDNLPNGPCWRRYTQDGYGQNDNGDPFLSTGVGRPWPLLTGERAHYELAAGRDPSPYVQAMERFAGERCLLAEQLWNAPNLSTPLINLVPGGPTGSSMPLAWAHAEYLKLVRSISDKRVYDLIQIVADRYLVGHAPSPLEIWNYNRQIPAIPRGKTLRLQFPRPFRLHASTDGWATTQDIESKQTAVKISFADIVTTAATPGPLKFTFYWYDTNQWEGRDYQVNLT